MSTNIILMYAIGVFTLMLIGIILTAIEFNRLTDESAHSKDAGSKAEPKSGDAEAQIRVVRSQNDAA